MTFVWGVVTPPGTAARIIRGPYVRWVPTCDGISPTLFYNAALCLTVV